MPKVIQAGDFFVVGGPVQPDRPCYVERTADAQLARGIAEQRFCYVLAARSTGKSSLLARTIRTLRREGQLAAVVDLSQLGARGESGEATRWYYNIAYRVLRELRLKFDLQGWWQEKSALGGEQRLAEFFWEVVLTRTSVPVTVFVDEIERTLALPFAQDLFATIHACYARRVSEPDYGRLNFVVLGVASPSALCPDTSISPFLDGLAIEVRDFTFEQSLVLAAGFDANADDGREIVERIHAWSGGQPYLTQRIARGVARRGGRVADVDRIVREQFLAPGAAEKDPYLSRIRMLLTRRGAKRRGALALLGKIARGASVRDEPRSAPSELLHLAGITACGKDGLLHYRNRILRDVFNDRWISVVRPFDWRAAGGIAALIAVAVLVPLWYSQFLPRPYIRTLSVVTQDFAVAEEAYGKLHRLPGFAGTADRLLAEAMVRRSHGAESHAEMLAADQVLRRLPDQTWLADQLVADYWLRRAAEATHRERRDEAVRLAVEALPAGGVEARRVLAELVGEDFERLRGTFRFAGRPVGWAVDWQAGRLAVVDRAHRAHRIALEPVEDGTLAGSAPAGRLTAQQHVPVQREIGVDEPGVAGAFRLDARIRHQRPSDLLLVLTAPSGADARLTLDPGGADAESYSFRTVRGSPLAALTDEPRQGVWRLTLVDRRSDLVGTLLDWGLSFVPGSSAHWRDAPQQGLAIPDPFRTEQVEITVSGDGRFAAARPARQGAVGSLAIWDLVDGRPLHDLELRGPPDFVAFDSSGSRLIVQVGHSVSLWDVGRGSRIAQLDAEHGFQLPPALSLDGNFVALAERDLDSPTKLTLVRAADGVVVASAARVAGARAWVLGPEARYSAVVEPNARIVNVVDPRRVDTERRLRHERDVHRLVPVPTGDWLLTVDDLGDVRAWRVPIDLARPGRDESYRIGTTVDADSLSVSADGSLVAFLAPQGFVVVRDILEDFAAVHLRLGPTDGTVATRLGPDGRSLVTAHGDRLRMWSVEPGELGELGELGGPTDSTLSALAIDAAGAVAALGFRGGHVRVRSASELSRSTPRTDAIDYLGHRGRVTSLAIHAPRARIASGGANGVVRVWDVASVAPSEHVMRHPEGPVQAVSLSPDGRWIASAAEYFARLWHADDGELADELAVNGTALAVGFAPDSTQWAVGDSAGNVFFAMTESGAPLGSVRAQGAVRAIAFSPDGALLASGDDTGHVEIWDTTTFTAVSERRAFAHPVRWIGFAASSPELLIQTEAWIHHADARNGRIRVVGSRLLPAGVAAGAALEVADDLRVRLVGGLGAGPIAFHDVSFAEPAAAPLEADSPLLGRDWTRVLGLDVSADGEIVPLLR